MNDDDEVEEELDEGRAAMQLLVEHMLRMGSCYTEHPSLVVDGQLYKMTVTVERNN